MGGGAGATKISGHSLPWKSGRTWPILGARAPWAGPRPRWEESRWWGGRRLCERQQLRGSRQRAHVYLSPAPVSSPRSVWVTWRPRAAHVHPPRGWERPAPPPGGSRQPRGLRVRQPPARPAGGPGSWGRLRPPGAETLAHKELPASRRAGAGAGGRRPAVEFFWFDL